MRRDDEEPLLTETCMDDGEEMATFTAEDAIESIGFGKFQIKVLAMIGFAWSADSLEMSLIAILAPAVKCYWGITHWHEASLTTIVFIGMFISTYMWGYVSDNYGRRKSLVIASGGIYAFGLLSTFSPNYWYLLAFRGLVGACMSGVVQGTTLVVEFLPVSTRGLTITFGGVFWSFGTCIEVIIAILVMPTKGWRWLLFLSAWPSLFFVLISILVKYPPESARFLVSIGKSSEAMEILQNAAKDNRKELPEGNLVKTQIVDKEDRGSVVALFQRGVWKVTIPLWIMWFVSHFSIYGLSLLAIALFSSSYTCYGNNNDANNNNDVECKTLTQEDYVHFLYVVAADFPAIIITAILVDTVGRKWMQAVGFFLTAVFFGLLLICTGSRTLATFFLFGVRCFSAVADIGGYIYTPEVYPTHIRGMALGACSGISRLGCMLTPFVAQVLTHYSLGWAFGIYITLSIIGGICSLLLPIETKGKGLTAIDKEMQSLGGISEINSTNCDETKYEETEMATKSEIMDYNKKENDVCELDNKNGQHNYNDNG